MRLLSRAGLDTPVGRLLAVASPTGLCSLEFDEPDRTARSSARFERWFEPCALVDRGTGEADVTADAVIADTEAWLREYFDGERPHPSRIPLDLRGTTFELSVWHALLSVPYGSTSTYGSIAERVGSPRGSRAVGLANGNNPVPLIVPCHRIIGTNGALTGYGGGLHRKAWLLRHEAVPEFDSLF